MKALGYVFLVFLVIGCWVIWQIIRRASAGAQAIINPERYAIQKVEQMHRDIFGDAPVLQPNVKIPDQIESKRREKWDALVKYDPEISAAAEKLQPYGNTWIEKLGHAYFALEENRAYLPNVVERLIADAQKEVAAEEEREEPRRRGEVSQLSNGDQSSTSMYRIASIDAQKLPPFHGTIWLDGEEIWFAHPSVDFSVDGRSYYVSGGETCFPRDKVGRPLLLQMLHKRLSLWAGDEATVKARLIELAKKFARPYILRITADGQGEPSERNTPLNVPSHMGKIWLDSDKISLQFPSITDIRIAGRPPLGIVDHVLRFPASEEGIFAAEAILSLRQHMMKEGNEELLLPFAERGTDRSAIFQLYKEILK